MNRYAVPIFLALALLFMIVGMLAPMTFEEAVWKYGQDLGQAVPRLKQADLWTRALLIFLNNFALYMIMFAPAIGVPLGLFFLYNTGLAVKATVVIHDLDLAPCFAALVVNPVFWLEMLAYTLAMVQSVRLAAVLMKHEHENALFSTAKKMLVCVAILAVAAIIEALLI